MLRGKGGGIPTLGFQTSLVVEASVYREPIMCLVRCRCVRHVILSNRKRQVLMFITSQEIEAQGFQHWGHKMIAELVSTSRNNFQV